MHGFADWSVAILNVRFVHKPEPIQPESSATMPALQLAKTDVRCSQQTSEALSVHPADAATDSEVHY